MRSYLTITSHWIEHQVRGEIITTWEKFPSFLEYVVLDDGNVSRLVLAERHQHRNVIAPAVLLGQRD